MAKRLKHYAPYLTGALGLGLIAVGVALVYLPAALIVVGVAVAGLALYLDDGK